RGVNGGGGGARLNDIEFAFVGGEGKPVRPIDITGGDGGTPATGIKPIDIGRQLGRGHVAFIVSENAEWRIGEPDRIVGFDHHVVGRIERFAVELVDQGGDGAVEFGTCQPARVVLTGTK